MHYHYIEDDKQDIVDNVPFCSDSCHQWWCEKNGVEYAGWNGAHEGADYAEYCAYCGVIANPGLENENACDCMRDNVVVNRFPREAGEQCQHGNWIQLPTRLVGHR